MVYNRIRITRLPVEHQLHDSRLTNPYNRIETQQANERVGSTETR